MHTHADKTHVPGMSMRAYFFAVCKLFILSFYRNNGQIDKLVFFVRSYRFREINLPLWVLLIQYEIKIKSSRDVHDIDI